MPVYGKNNDREVRNDKTGAGANMKVESAVVRVLQPQKFERVQNSLPV